MAFCILYPYTPVEDLGNFRGEEKQLEIPGGGSGSWSSWASILGGTGMGWGWGCGCGAGHILPHVLDKGDIYIIIPPTSILYLESHFYFLNFISCTYLEYMCKINREYQMKF